MGGRQRPFYIYSDHLGSSSLATSSTGVKVPGSESRYYPFGGWRTEPAANLTDRGFTGHLHNNMGTGADNIGLVYMGARWYLPGLGRFISADTIIPNPTNPQSLNRYSYVRNSPLNMTDPTGHRETDCESETNCSPTQPLQFPPSIPEQVASGSNIYGIKFTADVGQAWTTEKMEATLYAARDIETRSRLEGGGNYADYAPGEIWKETHGIVTMLASSKTQYMGTDGLLHDITYGAETFGSTIEVYGKASTNMFNFKLNMVHEFGHVFNGRTVNTTDMNPSNDLAVAIGDGGALNGLALRGGMPPRPYQQSIQSTPGELIADYYVNWVYGSFSSNPIGSKQSEWMYSQMSIWLER